MPASDRTPPYSRFPGDFDALTSRGDINTQAQGFKGQNFERVIASGGGAMVSGTAYFMGLAFYAGEVVTNIHPRIITAGAGVSLSKVAVFDKNGVSLATSADLGASWQSGGMKTHALSTPLVIPATDLYYLALLSVFATTAPQPLRATAVSGAAEAVGTGKLAFGAQTGLADLPAPATIANGNQLGFWVGWS